MDDINKVIGKNLRAFRIESGMTQSELGGIIGVTFQQVQKYEKGESKVTAALLYKFCRIFGAPLDSFFDWEAMTFSMERDILFPRLARAYAKLPVPKRQLLLNVARQMDCSAEGECVVPRSRRRAVELS
jgi:transcriptional regulator with XRE-family HTH domain